MINNAVLIGRLTKDIELRQSQSGKPYISFVLAVNRDFKKEGQPDADFINCVAWNKTAENMAQYLHKGSLIGVEGRIQTRNYENQQGQRIYITEVLAHTVHFLESKSDANKPKESNYGQQQNRQNQPTKTRNNAYSQPNMNFTNADIDAFEIGEDDLPF